MLPKDRQIPSDFFRKGDNVRGIIESVELKGAKPSIVLSRTSPKFLEQLFHQEIPEVFDGLITIKKVVRIPGEKAKVAVDSYDDRIDPVGACVGMKGSRIHGIVRELGNENIDVINWLFDDYPVKAQGMGGRQVRTGREHGEIYDHHFVEFTYGNGSLMSSQCRHIAGCWNSVSEFAHGSKGWAEISRGRIYDKDGKEIWRAPRNVN